MSDRKPSQIDELLAKAEALRTRAERGAGSEKREGVAAELADSIASVAENLSFFRRLTASIVGGALGFYERFLRPVWQVVYPPLRWVARGYGRIWNRFAYCNSSQSGDRVLSRSRAGLLIGATIVFVSIFTPTALGNFVRFLTVEPLSDGFLMAISKNTETFYLSHSEEIDPLGNVHSVRGCKHAGQCTELDAAYFRVLPRLSHDLWKLFTQGNPIFVPDHVVAPIAPGVNRCEVTYYGYRMTSSWISRLMRSLQVYPVMLDAQCTYLGAQAQGQNTPLNSQAPQ